MTFGIRGVSLIGILPSAYAEQASALSLDAFGANCGIGPAELLDTVQGFATVKTDAFVIAKVVKLSLNMSRGPSIIMAHLN